MEQSHTTEQSDLNTSLLIETIEQRCTLHRPQPTTRRTSSKTSVILELEHLHRKGGGRQSRRPCTQNRGLSLRHGGKVCRDVVFQPLPRQCSDADGLRMSAPGGNRTWTVWRRRRSPMQAAVSRSRCRRPSAGRQRWKGENARCSSLQNTQRKEGCFFLDDKGWRPSSDQRETCSPGSTSQDE